MENRGVFWLIEGELLVVLYDEKNTVGLSKKGRNYNHKELWDHVKPKGCQKTFDYYPRGRLEVTSKGKPVIYMSQFIDEVYLPELIKRFNLTKPPRVHIDGSRHYQCYLDEDYHDTNR
ncbi:hypothetical protein SAMN06296386_109109 [Lachnospiraceae bacterium]|nr:hypothetical protein SAMN06296386_109109 [Lachnospiraceae bacterium]